MLAVGISYAVEVLRNVVAVKATECSKTASAVSAQRDLQTVSDTPACIKQHLKVIRLGSLKKRNNGSANIEKTHRRSRSLAKASIRAFALFRVLRAADTPCRKSSTARARLIFTHHIFYNSTAFHAPLRMTLRGYIPCNLSHEKLLSPPKFQKIPVLTCIFTKLVIQ